jgi:uncharacterized repeat protein (TIGR01451 family)
MADPAPPSRQALVVPPRSSNLPVVLGAVICGCIGFGLVWAFGIGRSRVERPIAAEPAIDPEFEQPSHPAPAAEHDDYPVRPASFEPAAAIVRAGGEAEPPAMSRFSRQVAADIDIPEARPAEEQPPAIVTEPHPEAEPATDTEPETETAPATATTTEPVSEPDPPLETDAEDPPAGAASEEIAPPHEVASPEPTPEPLIAETVPQITAPGIVPEPAINAAEMPTPEISADNAPQSNPQPPQPQPPAPEPFAAPLEAAPVPPPAPSPFAQAPPVRNPDYVPPPPPASGGLVPRFAPPPAAFPVMPAPVMPSPVAPPPAVLAASVPFAAAPPMAGGPAGPTGNPLAANPLADPGYDAASLFERRGPAAEPPAVAGQGRPGPVQLEGVQSPQLTVEKRGPREVQVGKPARYEIFVRNVGSATAQDVFLRDAVPYGTSLITTTPPAAPGQSGPDAELVWPLGELPPGGQARVVIELMPQTEGDIGSVASVSFRAEASVRSRATKPALAITSTPPEPTRIGRDAGLSITVTNPGTGIATGVVLEGFLPENVSHRSGRELEFDVGQLKPGESRTIDLVLGTRGPGIHTARFAARADGGLEVEEFIKLEVTAPTLELAIDMPVRRFLQRTATCEIAMVNAGTATARSIELAAQLPPGMKFVRANNAGWHDERTNRVLWNLEELPAGETGAVEVVVMPVDLGPQKIVAAARSADGLADQAVHVCEVEGLAALSFEVTDSEDPIEVEGLTEYVIRVGNQGTKPATGVRLVATLLGDLEPVDARGPAGHRVENLVVLFEPLASLAPAEEAVYRVRARGRSAGDQRVQIQLMSADHPAPITKEEVTRVYSDR